MPLIDIDPRTFEAASRTIGTDAATAAWNAWADLAATLSDCAAMAGSDPIGVRGADAYNAAVVDIAGVTQDVINGCYQSGSLLEATGFNHGLANSASTPGGTGRHARHALLASSRQWEARSRLIRKFYGD